MLDTSLPINLQDLNDFNEAVKVIFSKANQKQEKSMREAKEAMELHQALRTTFGVSVFVPPGQMPVVKWNRREVKFYKSNSVLYALYDPIRHPQAENWVRSHNLRDLADLGRWIDSVDAYVKTNIDKLSEGVKLMDIAKNDHERTFWEREK